MKREVLVTNFELMRVLEGHPVTFCIGNDFQDEVVVRLATPREIIDKHEDACRRSNPHVNPSMSMKQAIDLSRPFPFVNQG